MRAASNSPATSISTATTTSYPPPPERSYAAMAQPMALYNDPYRPGMMVHAPAPPYQPMYSQPGGLPSLYAAGSPQAGYYAQSMAPSGYPAYPGAPPPGPPAMGYAPQFPPTVMPSPPQTGMFTRNLIGSLSVNAFTLRDPEGKEGHWFILQDLSVRTEGNFRYVSNPSSALNPTNQSNQTENELHRRRLHPRRQIPAKPRQSPRPGILLLPPLPSLLGQEIPRCN